MTTRDRMMLWMICGAMMTASACGEGVFEHEEGAQSEELSEELSSMQRAWRSGVFSGDLGIRLSWEGPGDLDLYVKTPLGELLSFRVRRDGRGGQLLKNSCSSSQCSGQTSEEIAWLESAPTGRYEIWTQRDDERLTEQVLIEVSRAGAIEQTFEVAALGAERGARSDVFVIDVEELPLESIFGGDLGLQLSWKGGADLDLHVITPSGEEIFYGDRLDGLGGELTKNICYMSRCDHTKSEEIAWQTLSPRGSFQIRVVNYNGGGATDVKLRMHSRREVLQSVDLDVPARRRAEVDVDTFAFDAMPLNPDGIQITSHSQEQWVLGQAQRFELDVRDEAIAHVALSINGQDVASSEGALGAVSLDHQFGPLGEHRVEAIGFDGDGMIVASEAIQLIVTDELGGLPPRGDQGAYDVSRAALARRIHELEGIELFTALFDSRHHRDEQDGVFADATNNILDASNNVTSATSCYGVSPCSRTLLDGEMLQAMLMIHQRHGFDFRVSTITGGEHSASSRHYDGIAFDINRINGGRLSTSTSTLNRQITSLCRQYGATEILSPPDAGHSTHIHCAWPRR